MVVWVLNALCDRGFDGPKLGGIGRIVVEELRKELDKERDVRAEAFFKQAVTAGDIQFRLISGRSQPSNAGRDR